MYTRPHRLENIHHFTNTTTYNTSTVSQRGNYWNTHTYFFYLVLESIPLFTNIKIHVQAKFDLYKNVIERNVHVTPNKNLEKQNPYIHNTKTQVKFPNKQRSFRSVRQRRHVYIWARYIPASLFFLRTCELMMSKTDIDNAKVGWGGKLWTLSVSVAAPNVNRPIKF